MTTRGKPFRKLIRLQGYDYALEGAYFVTICTAGNRNLFGSCHNGSVKLSPHGQLADETWRMIPHHIPGVELGAHIVMTNHVHGIIIIVASQHAAFSRAMAGPQHAATLQKSAFAVTPGSLGTIVRSYKSAVTKRLHETGYSQSVWQPNYYEHLIRNDGEWKRINEYIETNPSRPAIESISEMNTFIKYESDSSCPTH